MADQKFRVGDKVKCPEYDRTERPPNRVGDAVVVRVEGGGGAETRAACESGWLVTIKSEKGWTVTLDQNWLEHG